MELEDEGGKLSRPTRFYPNHWHGIVKNFRQRLTNDSSEK